MVETLLSWIGLAGAALLALTGVILLAIFTPKWLQRRRAGSASTHASASTMPPPPGYAAPPAPGRPGPGVPLRPAKSPRGALAGSIVGAVLLAAAIPLGVVSAGPVFTATAAAGGLPTRIVSESDTYRFTESTTLGEYESARYNFRFDPRESVLEAYEAQRPNDQLVAAYYDSELTRIANYSAETEVFGNGFALQPEEITVIDADYNELGGERDPGSYGEAGSWSVTEIYLVQYVDRDGTEYDKPIVTRAVIEPDEKTLAAPSVDYEVSTDGVLQLSWQPVDGAERYIPVYANVSDLGNNTFFMLGDVGSDATSWSSTSGQTRDCYLIAAEVVSQNCSLEPAFVRAEDSDLGAYGVLAIAADGTRSFVDRIDAAPINPLIPVGVGGSDIGSGEYNGSLDRVPSFASVTTLTDASVSLPLTLVGSRTDGETGVLEVKVAGTDVVRELRYSGIDGTWGTFVEAVGRKLSEAAVTKAGAIQASLRQADADVQRDAPISSSQPEVDIPLTDEFGAAGEYLSANLLAGNRRIDLTGAAESPYDPIELASAVISQTPAALVRSFDVTLDFSESTERRILEVTYVYPQDQLAERREQTWSAAQDVVAEIVADGMDERDTALALNDWIAANADYDQGAYQAYRAGGDVRSDPTYAAAWDASGILLDGTGVCASYAAAFKLLSDVAGIETVYLSGAAYSVGHAWNKTFMDGRWQVVDPTWNDSEAAPNALFGISDEIAASEFGHTFGPGGWMIPTLAGQYAAE
ncbi:transglutaminase domain-containing protein [Arenivirga flava]|uniref:Transglutaminase-like domain-containing protein n=1 Tax=Arenivirga flava TaxID=1930060 RepID=A0AA37UHC6_9MICO|nr:transglutaminase domain-containing protein [Arenivirga flava]GMA28838.1 hypothetical protein GCM10025874_20910 [Arenivirga flava]